jgi:serine/threonine protein kinase
LDELRQLGKYRIGEVIGASALATVYKAIDPEPERTVALKIVRKSGIDPRVTAHAIAKFRNQMLAAERLAHPGIVDVYEHGEDESVAFLAMEYLAGRGLRDFLTLRLRLGLKDTMSIMSQLLAALDFAHANGVVHRDVKPANIIMLLSGRLKLADFGTALIDSFDLSHSGPAAGTPAYMSPEQHSALEADRRSDIFSCGVVLYELLTGSKPFEGPPDAVSEKILREPYRPASELNPKGSPAALDAVIAKALAKKPEERFPTARDFAAALEAAFRDGSDAPRAIEPEHPASVTVKREDSFPHLQPLEALLTRYIGPMAKVLLKQSARASGGGAALVSALAQYVPTEDARKAFIAEAMEKISAGAAREEEADGPSVRFSRNLVYPWEIETAVNRLARYLGPIAKVIAKKTPGRQSDLRGYYRQLAQNIADPESRARFLKEAGYDQ